MCFSPEASFGTGIILSVIGVAAVRKVTTPMETAFAAIPILFSFQQMTEGFVWMAILYPELMISKTNATYAFLIAAQIIWPVYVPMAMFYIEKENSRKKILKVFCLTGIIISSYCSYLLLFFPVHTEIITRHISYQFDFPVLFPPLGSIIYFATTVIPPFISGRKGMWTIGAAVMISYIISKIFFEDSFVSVWCFFAAVISIMVFFIMSMIQKNQEHPVVKASVL